MNVAIIGFGKLGQKIAQLIEIDADLNLVLTINSQNLSEFNTKNLNQVDLAFELAGPDHAYANLSKLAESKVTTISGSTGWTDKLAEIEKKFTESDTSFLYASNFSLGMNIFFELNRKLAQLMNGKAFEAQIDEVHHIHKLDSPSGTSLTIANDLIENHEKYDTWKLGENASPILPIHAERKGQVNGDHTVTYQSPFEILSMHHSAKDRAVFAQGAIAAAKWIKNKKGIFSMRDVIGI